MVLKKFLLLSVLLLGLFGCKQTTPTRPIVLSTTGMIQDIVQAVGGEAIHSVGLMGPGVDPHVYKASAGDIKKLSTARIIFYNGLHLEAKLIDVFEQMASSKPCVSVTDSIPTSNLILPDNYEGFYDPHVWFDVSLWITATNVVATTLINEFPTHKDTILSNRDTYIESLTALDKWITESVTTIPADRRLLVTAHDAFGYFGKRYGFTVIGLQGISTASEAGTYDIQRTASIIIEHKIPTIFIETAIPVRTIQALQAAVESMGAQVAIGAPLYTDAMGPINTPEGTYVGMIRHNVTSIINGLK